MPLSEDVMYLIASYLDVRSIGRMAVASSHMYRLVVPQHFSHTVIGSGHRGKSKCAYLFQRDSILDTIRASYIRHLEVIGILLDDSEYFDEAFTAMKDVLPVLYHAAPTLRTVGFYTSYRDGATVHFEREPLLLNVIATMPMLATLHLNLDPTLFPHFSAFPPDAPLKSLYLNFTEPLVTTGHTITFSDFVLILARFTHLHDFHVQCLDTLLGWHVHHIAPPGLPFFQSLLDLDLGSHSTVALPLVPLCPRLSSLSCASVQLPIHALLQDSCPYNGPRWPPLRTLTLSLPTGAPLLSHWAVASRAASSPTRGVAHVHLKNWKASATTLDAVDTAESRGLAALLSATWPVALTLEVVPSRNAPGPGSGMEPERTWRKIAGGPHRLRSVDITVHTRRDEDIIPGVLCTALAGLPLVHLSVEERPHFVDERRGVVENRLAFRRKQRDAPRALAAALPTLKVFHLRGWEWDPLLDSVFAREDDGAPDAVAELRELEASLSDRSDHWWWIEDEMEKESEGDREMVEIWREDGEAARELVRSLSFDLQTSLKSDEGWVVRISGVLKAVPFYCGLTPVGRDKSTTYGDHWELLSRLQLTPAQCREVKRGHPADDPEQDRGNTAGLEGKPEETEEGRKTGGVGCARTPPAHSTHVGPGYLWPGAKKLQESRRMGRDIEERQWMRTSEVIAKQCMLGRFFEVWQDGTHHVFLDLSNMNATPRLNDDIMYLTLPYIDPSNLAMTSSHMYQLAFSVRFADVSIEVGRRGKAQADFLLQRDPVLNTVRASNIRRLFVESPHDDTIDFTAHILPVLQHSAAKLRNLRVVPSYTDGFERDPRLLAAITTMPKLTSLDLSLDPTLFSHLSNFPADTVIETLVLVFSSPTDGIGRVTFSAFVTTLARFPRLRDLNVGFLDFILHGPVNPIAPPGLAPLPSLASLSLGVYSTVALPLCPLCPRLSSLRCQRGQLDLSALPSDLGPYTGPRWPPIRSLSLSLPRGAPLLSHWSVAHRVASGSAGVARVAIERWPADARTLDAVPDAAESTGLPYLLAAMKPVALVLDVAPCTAGAHTPTLRSERTWQAIAAAPRRLRSLDLTIGGHAPPDGHEPLVPDVLCTALAGLPLVHLAIEERPHSNIAGFPVSHAAELARIQRLLRTPRALVEALPTVRVLQVRGACPAVLPRTAEVREQDEGEAAALAELRRIQEEVQRRERWWWAEDVLGAAGAERTLVELWREDGERAREIVEGDDFDVKTSFNVDMKISSTLFSHQLGLSNMNATPQLNDDIMHLILPYIDPFNMAMTSSHMYRLAFSVRFADVSIEVGRRGKAQAEFLLQRDQVLNTVRASNIRRLFVEYPHDDTIDFTAHILPLIQHSAARLRSLGVVTSDPDGFEGDPRLLATITAMPQLTSLHLSLDPTLFSRLSHFPSDTIIETLVLVFSDPGDSLGHLTFSTFVTALARFPRLRDLNVGPLDLLLGRAVDPIAPPGLVPLQNLVSLSLEGHSAVALPLCPLCPRLSSLRCDGGQLDLPTLASELDPYTGPRWPAIRSLSLSVPGGAPLLAHWPVARRVASGSAGVVRVRIESWSADARTFDAESDVVETLGLPQLLAATKPVALVLDVVPSTAPAPASTAPQVFPERTWRAIAGAPALRLRSLDLTIRGHAPPDGQEPIVPGVLRTALAGLPLVHLAVQECAHYTDAGFPVSHAAELRRIRRLLGAPRALVDAIPTVRILQVRGACPAVLPRTAKEVGEQDEGEAAALAELRRMEKEEVQRWERWWWAENALGAAGNERALVELWREDGERARDIVEGDDFDAKTSFDGVGSVLTGAVGVVGFMLPKRIYRP
ncbi:uncharacterized protein BXZ73DRAFT_76037 [Epithele typhae]|uniref:uncharacterized protein n=1 Tax=Epithele typhae TaxID=378194 RepID=UPI0020087907|nr:uncharacterized protein BXZ73DRAFT_76037 [Epithele typhae]KAH9939324.1 hypothetical protein BXZ73DRAFT_76037 [Epithele typhae]